MFRNVRIQPVNPFWNESTTPLGGSATFTGTAKDAIIDSPVESPTAATGVSPYAQFRAYAFTDQAGTLRIDVSNDNTTFRTGATVAVTASAPFTLSVPVVARYFRVVLVNGATPQTLLNLNCGFESA
jgi:hypothetical protein